MNVRINQAEKLKKEIRRKNWIKRVKKQRKRYLSRALKGSSMRKFTWQKQAFSEMLSFFLWVWLGVLMLAVSWVLFLRMGTASFEQSDIVQETQNTQEMQEEDWSGEIFGVEVRVQDGRIVFFQERKGRVLEGE
jgi:hypothetical protein